MFLTCFLASFMHLDRFWLVTHSFLLHVGRKDYVMSQNNIGHATCKYISLFAKVENLHTVSFVTPGDICWCMFQK